MNLTFDAVLEPKLGAKWQKMFRQAWPGWRDWYVKHGGERGPSLAACEQALLRHMPELVPVWRRQVELAGGCEPDVALAGHDAVEDVVCGLPGRQPDGDLCA